MASHAHKYLRRGLTADALAVAPVRANIGAKPSTPLAPHARAERWHCQIVRKPASINDRVMMAVVT